MRIDYFIDLIPPTIEWITHLKVDTEGHDSAVLSSAGDSLSRFIFVSIEDPVDSSILIENGFHIYRRQKGSTTYANGKFTGPLEGFDIALRA
jgi:hypothetical protein